MPVIFMCVCSTTSSSPRANVIRRCLPFDSTARTTLPITSKRAASELIRGATISKAVTIRPASARYLVLVAIGESEERALVTCEPRSEHAVDQDDERAGGPHRMAPFRALRPRERGAIQVRGIRG